MPSREIVEIEPTKGIGCRGSEESTFLVVNLDLTERDHLRIGIPRESLDSRTGWQLDVEGGVGPRLVVHDTHVVHGDRCGAGVGGRDLVNARTDIGDLEGAVLVGLCLEAPFFDVAHMGKNDMECVLIIIRIQSDSGVWDALAAAVANTAAQGPSSAQGDDEGLGRFILANDRKGFRPAGCQAFRTGFECVVPWIPGCQKRSDHLAKRNFGCR